MPCRPLRRIAAAAAVALALTTAALTAGCGPDKPVSPLSGQPGGSTDAAGGSAGVLASGSAPAVPLAGFTPRSIRYLNADITLTGVELSRQTPRSYGDTAGPEYGTATYAYLQVKVTNRLNFTTLLISQDVSLALAGGASIAFDDSGGPAAGVVNAGATATGWYAFELPANASVPGSSLVFGPAGYQQERLPLTGAVPEPAYPKPITLASPGTVRQLGVTVEKAYLAHWIGIDNAGHSSTTKQARTGRLKLYLGIAVTAPVTVNGAFIDVTSDVHVVVNGERLGDYPEIYTTTNVNAGATDHEYLVYDIPASGKVEIEWGPLGGPQVRLPVPLG